MSSTVSMATACSAKNLSIKGRRSPAFPWPLPRRMSSFSATYHLFLSEDFDFIPPRIPAIALFPGEKLDPRERLSEKPLDPLPHLVRLSRMLPRRREHCLHDPLIGKR